MLKQPERESRNVNDFFYEMEGRQLQKMNKVLAGVELTKAEERTLIGNEGNGLRQEVADCADTWIRIPMAGQVESLNAAVASAVLMFEVSRQRR